MGMFIGIYGLFRLIQTPTLVNHIRLLFKSIDASGKVFLVQDCLRAAECSCRNLEGFVPFDLLFNKKGFFFQKRRAANSQKDCWHEMGVYIQLRGNWRGSSKANLEWISNLIVCPSVRMPNIRTQTGHFVEFKLFSSIVLWTCTKNIQMLYSAGCLTRWPLILGIQFSL